MPFEEGTLDKPTVITWKQHGVKSSVRWNTSDVTIEDVVTGILALLKAHGWSETMFKEEVMNRIEDEQ